MSSNAPSLGSAGAPGLQVDLNSIPTGLIDRIETIQIGGAPIYGSDAIAGTVNIILKRDFEGVQADAQYGVSDKGDANNWRVRGLVGGNFGQDKKGNAVVAVEYSRQRGLLANRRARFRDELNFVSNPNDTGPNDGIPDNILIRNSTVNAVNTGGIPSLGFGIPNPGFGNLITDANGNALAFAPNGDLVPYNFGNVTNDMIFSSGGDGLRLNDFSQLLSPTQRFNINANGHYEFRRAADVYVEASYYNATAQQLVNQPIFQTDLFGGDSSAIQFSADNPFLNSQARAILAQNGADSFFLSRASTDIVGANGFRSETSLYRVVSGVRGDFSFFGKDWSYDISYNFGRNRSDFSQTDVNNRNFFNAIDAVRDPATGRIVCNVTLNPPPAVGFGGAVANDNSVTGCQPLDLFGFGAPSQAAINFVTATVTSFSVIDQQDFSGFAAGPLVHLPGGDVQVSLGYEFRRERARFEPDDFLREGLGRNSATLPTGGEFNTREGYAEVEIPLVGAANRLPFVYSATLEGRGRYISNSRSGGAFVYTGGARFAPVKDLTFRGNYTHSVRSPALTELFLPLSSIFTFANDPCDSRFIGQGPNPATRQANCQTSFSQTAAPGQQLNDFISRIVNATQQGTSVGNPDLQNEVANSWTVGTVIQPHWVKGLRIAADWNQIDISNAIENLDATSVLEACFDAASFPNNFCSRFTRDSNFQITNIATGFANAGQRRFAGLTAEVEYRFSLNDLGFIPLKDAGDIGLNFTYFYLSRQTVSITGFDFNNNANEVGNTRQNFQFNLEYSRKKFSALLTTNYQGAAVFNRANSAESQDFLGVGKYYIFDLALNYDITKNIRARVVVNNLANADIPFPSQANSGVYDAIGRRFVAGVNLRF